MPGGELGWCREQPSPCAGSQPEPARAAQARAVDSRAIACPGAWRCLLRTAPPRCPKGPGWLQGPDPAYPRAGA